MASGLRVLAELRTNIASTVRETQAGVLTLIDNYLNLTLAQIWDFHPWTFARHKTTFPTVVSQEDYNLDEEIDRIMLIRQRTVPLKLIQIPDHLFYRFQPDPEGAATGPPRYYRPWEETGFATNLAAADTVQVLSSSTADGSSVKVVIVGRESTNNLQVSEEMTLNGTTAATSTNTYAASGLMRCSKSARTTGTITVRRTTGATTLAFLAPEELAPRYKRISLYPIPSAVVTIYVEYIERLRFLINDADVPQLDYKWNWVLREGALAKTWAYKQNEEAAAISEALFAKGLLQMRNEDERNMDYIPVIEPRIRAPRAAVIRYADSVNGAFPSYGAGAW